MHPDNETLAVLWNFVVVGFLFYGLIKAFEFGGMKGWTIAIGSLALCVLITTPL